MFTTIFLFILVAATLASGLVAGVFLTFSDFVMRSLGRAQPAAGIEAMQMINRGVYRSQFMVLLIGMSFVSIILALAGVLFFERAVGGWLLAGGISYVGGVMAVTGRANVPMNHKLDREDPATPSALELWQRYTRVWTRWNHVRTLGSLAATLCYLAAALALAAS